MKTTNQHPDNKMKKINYIIVALVAILAASCNKDGDFLTTNGADSVTVDGSGSPMRTPTLLPSRSTGARMARYRLATRS